MTLSRRALLQATAATVAGLRAIPARARRYGQGQYGTGLYGGRG